MNSKKQVKILKGNFKNFYGWIYLIKKQTKNIYVLFIGSKILKKIKIFNGHFIILKK
jgi:hypothetical protein